MITLLEVWLENQKEHIREFNCINEHEGPTAIAVIQKLKGVIHHVAKKEHKPWLKKCLEDALAIDPSKL